jgi:hypothetical protein
MDKIGRNEARNMIAFCPVTFMQPNQIKNKFPLYVITFTTYYNTLHITTFYIFTYTIHMHTQYTYCTQYTYKYWYKLSVLTCFREEGGEVIIVAETVFRFRLVIVTLWLYSLPSVYPLGHQSFLFTKKWPDCQSAKYLSPTIITFPIFYFNKL